MSSDSLSKYVCPHCATELEKIKSPTGIFWSCKSCEGRAVGLSLLRDLSNPRLIQQFWIRALKEGRTEEKPCISCQESMLVASVAGQNGQVDLDVCKKCQFIWFDREEFAKIPKSSPEELQKKIKSLYPQQTRPIENPLMKQSNYFADIWPYELLDLLTFWVGRD